MHEIIRCKFPHSLFFVIRWYWYCYSILTQFNLKHDVINKSWSVKSFQRVSYNFPKKFVHNRFFFTITESMKRSEEWYWCIRKTNNGKKTLYYEVFLEYPTFTPPLLQGHTPPPMSLCWEWKMKGSEMINLYFLLKLFL